MCIGDCWCEVNFFFFSEDIDTGLFGGRIFFWVYEVNVFVISSVEDIKFMIKFC